MAISSTTLNFIAQARAEFDVAEEMAEWRREVVAQKLTPASVDHGGYWEADVEWLLDVSFLSLYRRYRRAMQRRRPDSVLSARGFLGYLCREGTVVYNHGGSYIIGQLADDGETFKVSHFAPATQRGGVVAVATLKEQPFNVVFAVTDDLAPMLAKLGYTHVIDVPMVFRDTLVKKQVFTNTADAAAVVLGFIAQHSF